jgi:DNA-binding transcriptional MerR regulator
MRIENKNTEVETLNESAAARMLGVSKVTLQRLRKRKLISHFRIGARVLYSPEHIRDFLKLIERKSTSQENSD